MVLFDSVSLFYFLFVIMGNSAELSAQEKLSGRDNYLLWSIRLRTMLRDKEAYKGVVKDPVDPQTLDDAGLREFRKRQIKAVALIQANVTHLFSPPSASLRPIQMSSGSTYNHGMNLVIPNAVLFSCLLYILFVWGTFLWRNVLSGLMSLLPVWPPSVILSHQMNLFTQY
jgi:hypothetical protein